MRVLGCRLTHHHVSFVQQEHFYQLVHTSFLPDLVVGLNKLPRSRWFKMTIRHIL